MFAEDSSSERHNLLLDLEMSESGEHSELGELLGMLPQEKSPTEVPEMMSSLGVSTDQLQQGYNPQNSKIASQN